MDLLSVFKRRADVQPATTATSDPADAVRAARTGARRRLIGAVVLVGIGVIGFPILFETQPRPIPVDIPIELPRKDGAAPLVMPSARAPVMPTRQASAAPVVPPPAVLPDNVITEAAEDAGSGAARAQPAPPSAAVSRDALRPLPKPPADASARPPADVQSKAGASARSAASASDTARARGLPEGTSVASSEAGRFVVQVGAFADAEAARDTRSRVEKLGLKTYTQVTSTAAGNRTRVRVGPFASRDDAEKALARARGAGLNAVLLTL